MSNDKIIRPTAFRQPAVGYEVEGARLQVQQGTRCAVDVFECVGLDEDGFAVIDAAAGSEIHFCARHALAAEALVSYGGFRGAVIPKLLALLDGAIPSSVETTCSRCGKRQEFKIDEHGAQVGVPWYVLNVRDGAAPDPLFVGNFCSTECLANAADSIVGGFEPGDVVAGQCRVCGCTEAHACAGGCSWADASTTLCTACV